MKSYFIVYNNFKVNSRMWCSCQSASKFNSHVQDAHDDVNLTLQKLGPSSVLDTFGQWETRTNFCIFG